MQDVRAAKACRTFAETFHPEMICPVGRQGKRGDSASSSVLTNGALGSVLWTIHIGSTEIPIKEVFEICMDQFFLRRRRFKGRKMVRTSFSDCMEYPAA